MKQMLVVLIAISMMISQENGTASISTLATVQTRHAIKNEQVRGKKTKTKLKSQLVVIPYNTEDIVVDDDQTFGRNRNRLRIVHEQEEQLSDYVKIRLMLARMKAMEKYREVWQS
jgi:hypothetical protein